MLLHLQKSEHRLEYRLYLPRLDFLRMVDALFRVGVVLLLRGLQNTLIYGFRRCRYLSLDFDSVVYNSHDILTQVINRRFRLIPMLVDGKTILIDQTFLQFRPDTLLGWELFLELGQFITHLFQLLLDQWVLLNCLFSAVGYFHLGILWRKGFKSKDWWFNDKV